MTMRASRGDLVIIGGGVMGAALACFLARDHGVAPLVIERDPAGTRASSALSASSIRQQFSTGVNIALSQWSLGFLRRVGDELAVDGEAPAIGLVEPGYLYLADSPAQADVLRANHAVQEAHGADVALLTAPQLHARFPWLATEALLLGALGLAGEGWFDGPALWRAFQRHARARGVRFVQAEAAGFETEGDHVAAVLGTRGERWPCDAGMVLAAGAWSAPLAARLGLTLPVTPKKRDVFVLDTPAALPACPLVITPEGVWFRPEGRGFIAGAPPRGGLDPDEPPLEAIDHGLFDDVIWPALARAVPAFEALRVRSAWAGYYEMNAHDHNGLAGPLPGWRNAWTACGFSGHGMQQAPAVGHSMARLIAGLEAPLIDALAPQRLLDGRPLFEANVI